MEPSATEHPVDLSQRRATPTLATTRPAAPPPRGQQADCGDFDIRIANDGTWYYHGLAMLRKPLVRLLSTALRRDAHGGYWLETPVERGRITVDDAPFFAVTLTASGQGQDQVVTFATSLDDHIIASAEHPIRVAEDAAGAPAPYVMVRDGLEARISRAAFYHLVDLGVERQSGAELRLGVWSAGICFDLGRLS